MKPLVPAIGATLRGRRRPWFPPLAGPWLTLLLACTSSRPVAPPPALFEPVPNTSPPESTAPVSTCPATPDACQAECDHGDPSACFERARMARRGSSGARRDDPRAATLFAKACEGGVADACAELGALHKYGDGVERDLERAVGLYRSACDAGSQLGCCGLGILYESGDSSLGHDAAKGQSLCQAACDEGVQVGCVFVGLMKWDRELYTEAVPLFEDACKQDDANGCSLLATAYVHGVGVPVDLDKARAFFQKSCDGGFDGAGGCAGLGGLYAIGKGVEKDPARAMELLETACERDARYCGYVAAELLVGERAPLDPVRAAELFALACSQRDAESCRMLARQHELGNGVDVDPSRALELYRRACELDDTAACEAALRLGGAE